MVADQSGFMRDRLASFVGRQAELVEIRQCIAKKMETDGSPHHNLGLLQLNWR